MERYAILAWLLDLIGRCGGTDPKFDEARERFEAIEVVFAGKRWLIRVDEVQG